METANQRDRDLRAARNQALFRVVNEKMRELNEAFSDVSETYAIACECADVSCVRLSTSACRSISTFASTRAGLSCSATMSSPTSSVWSPPWTGMRSWRRLQQYRGSPKRPIRTPNGQCGGGRFRDRGGAPSVVGEASTGGTASPRRARRPVRSELSRG